jgi:hypothetical protein
MALSLEERVREAAALLALITTATMVEDDHSPIEPDDVLRSIHEAALRAHNLLRPLREMPGTVGNWEPKGGAR